MAIPLKTSLVWGYWALSMGLLSAHWPELKLVSKEQQLLTQDWLSQLLLFVAVVGAVAGEEMIKKVVTVTINVTVGTAKVAWWVAISPLRLIVDSFRDGVRD